MSMHVRKKALLFAPLLVLAACESATSGPEDSSIVNSPPIAFAVGDVIPKPAADDLGEKFVVCKTGPAAMFAVRQTAPTAVDLGTITIEDGDCTVVFQTSGVTKTIEVTEIVPTGATLESVTKTQLTCAINRGCAPKHIQGPDPASNPVSGFVGGSEGTSGLAGVLAEFTNRLIPREGGEGCTPGYWKNHTGLKEQTNQWPPTGYGQGDPYDGTFGVMSSFHGTLLEALNRGGGGEKALGRHAVAALLNAAHAGVSSDLTVAEVIAVVQGAYAPGGDFETAKNQLAAFNEQGCPIGN
jgi:hypothetical protein